MKENCVSMKEDITNNWNIFKNMGWFPDPPVELPAKPVTGADEAVWGKMFQNAYAETSFRQPLPTK